jgi:hypothetical protein
MTQRLAPPLSSSLEVDSEPPTDQESFRPPGQEVVTGQAASGQTEKSPPMQASFQRPGADRSDKVAGRAAPRLIDLVVSSANERSTRLSQQL